MNTLGGMRGVRPNEHLHTYADLVAFARQAGALREDAAVALRAAAERHPSKAEDHARCRCGPLPDGTP